MKDNWLKDSGEIRAEKFEPEEWLEGVDFSPGNLTRWGSSILSGGDCYDLEIVPDAVRAAVNYQVERRL